MKKWRCEEQVLGRGTEVWGLITFPVWLLFVTHLGRTHTFGQIFWLIHLEKFTSTLSIDYKTHHFLLTPVFHLKSPLNQKCQLSQKDGWDNGIAKIATWKMIIKDYTCKGRPHPWPKIMLFFSSLENDLTWRVFESFWGLILFFSLSLLIHFIGTHIFRIILQFISRPFSSRLHWDYYGLWKRLFASRSRKLRSEIETTTPSLCMKIERKAFLPAVFGTHTRGFVYPWLHLCAASKRNKTPHILPWQSMSHFLSSKEKLLLVSKAAYTYHLSFTKCKGQQGGRGVGILKNSGNLLTGWRGLFLVSR